MPKEKAIIIGGGVGPLAGVEFNKLIIQHTKTKGTDQDHLIVLLLSNSPEIPDRTRFLLKKDVSSPAVGMLHTMQALDAAARSLGREAVGGVPCNTFHAPEIWNEFTNLMRENGVKIQMVNMIEETAKMIRRNAPNAKKIGLMTTDGTRKVGVYQKVLEPMGLEIIEVPEETQIDLQDTIYHKEWGIKGANPDMPRARRNFLGYSEELIRQGAQVIIPGCTEIPLVLPENEIKGVPLINPMVALARALIREANPEKLRQIL